MSLLPWAPAAAASHAVQPLAKVGAAGGIPECLHCPESREQDSGQSAQSRTVVCGLLGCRLCLSLPRGHEGPGFCLSGLRNNTPAGPINTSTCTPCFPELLWQRARRGADVSNLYWVPAVKYPFARTKLLGAACMCGECLDVARVWFPRRQELAGACAHPTAEQQQQNADSQQHCGLGQPCALLSTHSMLPFLSFIPEIGTATRKAENNTPRQQQTWSWPPTLVMSPSAADCSVYALHTPCRSNSSSAWQQQGWAVWRAAGQAQQQQHPHNPAFAAGSLPGQLPAAFLAAVLVCRAGQGNAASPSQKGRLLRRHRPGWEAAGGHHGDAAIACGEGGL